MRAAEVGNFDIRLFLGLLNVGLFGSWADLAKIFRKVQLSGEGGPLFGVELTEQLIFQKYIILLALSKLSSISYVAISSFRLPVIALVHL